MSEKLYSHKDFDDLLFKEFVEKIKNIIADIEFDMKNSQRLSLEEDEPLYYEGHWVGMDAVRVDYLYPLKEEYEDRLK